MDFAPIASLDGLGSGPMSDANEAMPLHLLCPECISMVRWVTERLRDNRSTSEKPIYGKPWDRSRYSGLSNQYSFKSLQESAARGCHMCSLLSANATIPNEIELLSSHLEYSISSAGMSLQGHHGHHYYSILPYQIMKPIGMRR